MSVQVDMGLFERTSHTPSYFSLVRNAKNTNSTDNNPADNKLRDFCIPVNPYFPTASMFDRYRASLERTLKYYPSGNRVIAECLSHTLELDADTMVMANGSTELISWISALFVQRGLATPVPTFGRWTDAARDIGKRVEFFPRHARDDFHLDVDGFVQFARQKSVDVVAICNPNNPTGDLLSPGELRRMIEELSDQSLIVVDESFLDFADVSGDPSMARHVTDYPNLVVLKSLGKSIGLHGIRAGYAIANADLAVRLRNYMPAWNVNSMAEAIIFDLQDHYQEFQQARAQVLRDSKQLRKQFSQLPWFATYPSQANFVYAKLCESVSGELLRDQLLTEDGCLVRMCGNKIGSTSQHFRFAARPRHELDYLLESVSRHLR